jgi:hypothetical protein|tara:strand:+ start:251 stop:391 length:141 start_codon:yes stop_codon:yes gene_type:complete
MNDEMTEKMLSALIDIRVAIEEQKEELSRIAEVVESEEGLSVTINK